MSTFSRSARIGSKICDRAGDAFSTAVQLETLSRPEQGVKVRTGAPPELRSVEAMHFRKRADHSHDVRGLVALAAEGHRRQKRTVGLGQQPIDRHAPYGLTQFLGARKRDDARER